MSRWSWPWFLTSAAILLVASQVIFTVSDFTCWKIALLATEYGHRIAVLALVLAVFHWRSGDKALRFLAWCNVLAAMVLFVPLVQAWNISRRLPEELKAAWGGENVPGEKPMEARGLWLGTWQTNQEPDRMEYAHDEDGGRALLLFRAQTSKPAPCVVAIHAGSWENRRKNEFPDWSTHWAARGYAVASIQYRLAPKYRWPAQREDVRLTLAFLKKHAAQLGLDESRFILLGRSAGGQIALASAYELGDKSVRGCVSLYGPLDLVFARTFAEENDVLHSPRLLRNYLGGELAKVEPNYASASPFLVANAQSCPTLMLQGSRDILVWNLQARRVAARLRLLGVPHYLLELPLAVHGFDWAYDGAGGQLARYALDQFFDTVCKSP
jgi:acetyl esterase/lipase